MSYSDRKGGDPDKGSAIQVSVYNGEVTLEMGVMRNFNSMSSDAWASLSPAEARELSDDLRRKAREAEQRS